MIIINIRKYLKQNHQNIYLSNLIIIININMKNK